MVSFLLTGTNIYAQVDLVENSYKSKALDIEYLNTHLQLDSKMVLYAEQKENSTTVNVFIIYENKGYSFKIDFETKAAYLRKIKKLLDN